MCTNLTSGVLNPTNAILRLLPSLVLSILQSVNTNDGTLEYKWCFTLESLNEGGKFLMHILVVVDVAVIPDDDGVVGSVVISSCWLLNGTATLCFESTLTRPVSFRYNFGVSLVLEQKLAGTTSSSSSFLLSPRFSWLGWALMANGLWVTLSQALTFPM